MIAMYLLQSLDPSCQGYQIHQVSIARGNLIHHSDTTTTCDLPFHAA